MGTITADSVPARDRSGGERGQHMGVARGSVRLRTRNGPEKRVQGYEMTCLSAYPFKKQRAALATVSRCVGQSMRAVSMRSIEVRLHFASTHQMDACEQHAIGVEQRFHPARTFLVEQLPSGLRESEVVVRVIRRDAARREGH